MLPGGGTAGVNLAAGEHLGRESESVTGVQPVNGHRSLQAVDVVLPISSSGVDVVQAVDSVVDAPVDVAEHHRDRRSSFLGGAAGTFNRRASGMGKMLRRGSAYSPGSPARRHSIQVGGRDQSESKQSGFIGERKGRADGMQRTYGVAALPGSSALAREQVLAPDISFAVASLKAPAVETAASSTSPEQLALVAAKLEELRAEVGSRITSLAQKLEQRMDSGIAELLEQQERSLLASFEQMLTGVGTSSV